MIRRFMDYFIRGLITALPLVLTVYLVYWVLNLAERSAKAIVGFFTPGQPDLPPGVGLLLGVLLLALLGFLTNLYLFRRFMRLAEKWLERIPLVKSIYGAAQDMMGFFTRSPSKGEANQAVAINFGENIRMLGLVTRTECADLPDDLARKEDIAVYLPMSYQLGGYTLFMPKDSVTSLDMSIERAMRLALTAGIGKDADTGESETLAAVDRHIEKAHQKREEKNGEKQGEKENGQGDDNKPDQQKQDDA